MKNKENRQIVGGQTITYKLQYYDKSKAVRNGIYSNIEDLVTAMYKEPIEYKHYCSITSTPLSFNDYLKKIQKELEELFKAAKEDEFVDLDYCRISLIND